MRITNKKLNMLTIIAIVLTIITVSLYIPRPEKEITLSKGSYLAGGLTLDDIATINISKGKIKTTLKKRDNGFVVTEKNNYPADTRKINELYTKVLDIKVENFITNKKANYKELGVSDDSKDATIISFKDDKGKLISGLIVGKTSDNGRGNYVRLMNKSDVYISDIIQYFNCEPSDYLNKTITKLKTSDVKRLDVIDNTGNYSINKNSSGEVVLLNAPKDKKIDKGALNSVFNSITSLNFNDVSKASDKSLDFKREVICEVEGKVKYHIYIAKQGEDTWIKAKAEEPKYSDIENSRRISKNDTESDLKNKSKVLDAGEAAKKFNKMTNGWVYKLASYKAEALNKKLSDLFVKDKDKKGK